MLFKMALEGWGMGKFEVNFFTGKSASDQRDKWLAKSALMQRMLISGQGFQIMDIDVGQPGFQSPFAHLLAMLQLPHHFDQR